MIMRQGYYSPLCIATQDLAGSILRAQRMPRAGTGGTGVTREVGVVAPHHAADQQKPEGAEPRSPEPIPAINYWALLLLDSTALHKYLLRRS